ncbi:hypothetical protein HMPREF0872_00475 [Veillonella montpellierensis DNF00314]|uniref:Tyr recombinase domain-containing protein n=1 Tax=Veillonella montpellierensis DNF00314 TaxID=1401067 RepID=A0A096AMS1_9FIRM|nr:site-specific integrase [Veillonella montpellierensis]KGF48110.1 hypothetical protein HMPREF0872_00475 [Veillonella montpellierensis DNF00314]
MASYSISTRQKDKNWQVIVSYKDRYGRWRQKSKQGFLTKRTAKDYGDIIVKEIKENLLLTNNEELANITFLEFSKIYFNDVKDTLRANSLITYQNLIKYVSPLYNLQLHEITPLIINTTLKNITSSTTSKKFIVSILKRIFSHAIKEYNLLSKNPVTATVPSEKINKPIRVITNEELDLYYNTISTSNQIYVAIKILQYTGIRIGELFALTQDDIDYKEMTISINKQFVTVGKNKNGIGPLKTKNSYRTIPIPKSLAVILSEYTSTCTTDRIITYKSTNALRKHIKKHINNHAPHDFRHTYATKLLANGMDVKTVAALLGDTVTTVINTYIHYSDEMRQSAKKDIQRIFD